MRQSSLLWLSAALVIAFTMLMTYSAVSDAHAMRSGNACMLRSLDFDNDSVETLAIDWWPPRVQCRYGYSYTQTGEEVWESRWTIYSPALLMPAAVTVTVKAARSSRRQRRRPILPT